VGYSVPMILILTTLALLLAQLPIARHISGAQTLGMFSIYLLFGDGCRCVTSQYWWWNNSAGLGKKSGANRFGATVHLVGLLGNCAGDFSGLLVSGAIVALAVWGIKLDLF